MSHDHGKVLGITPLGYVESSKDVQWASRKRLISFAVGSFDPFETPRVGSSMRSAATHTSSKVTSKHEAFVVRARYRVLRAGLAVLVCILCVVNVPLARAGEVAVAVASNFIKPLSALVTTFESQTGHHVLVSAGSTGKLYAQILNGAPFDVFLSANSREPVRLENQGAGLAGTRFTYGRGRLAFWAGGTDVDPASVSARICGTERFASANAKTAPYGVAAMQVVAHLGCQGNLQGRLVQGENIAQTYQFIASGNVAFGFVALSQLSDAGHGEFWVVPESMHAPIDQQALRLAHATGNPAASAFIAFLASEQAGRIICGFGYARPDCE